MKLTVLSFLRTYKQNLNVCATSAKEQGCCHSNMVAWVKTAQV